MKKKLLAIALVFALCISALGLAACGSKFGSLYSDKMWGNNKLNSYLYPRVVEKAEKLDALQGSQLSGYDTDTNLGVFVKSDGETGSEIQTIYNFKTDKIIGTFTDVENQKTEDATIDTLYYVYLGYLANDFEDIADYFTVKKKVITWLNTIQIETEEYSLYDADGNLIAVAEDEPYRIVDTLFVGNDYYRVKKGAIVKAGSRPENANDLSHLWQAYALNGNYYYFDGSEISVYGSDFIKPIAYHNVSDPLANSKQYLLNDGNVLIQSWKAVPSDATEYTYYEISYISGEAVATRYKLTTQIFDVKKNEVKNIDVDYIIESCTARDMIAEDFESLYLFQQYSKDVNNFATIYEIKDKMVVQDEIPVSLKNNGEIDQRFDRLFVGATGSNVPQPVAKNRFILNLPYNTLHLTDGNGKFIADITGAKTNNKYIVLNGKVYDYDFKEIAEYDKEKWTLSKKTNTQLFYFEIADETSEDFGKKFMIFTYDGTFKEIVLGEGESIVDRSAWYYCIQKSTDGTTTYTYYNANGDVLVTNEYKLTYKTRLSIAGKILFETRDKDRNIVTYAFSFASK